MEAVVAAEHLNLVETQLVIARICQCRTSLQHAAHRGDELVDQHRAIAVEVESRAGTEPRAAGGDVDAVHQLVDHHLPVAVAIAGADLPRRLRRQRQQRHGKRHRRDRKNALCRVHEDPPFVSIDHLRAFKGKRIATGLQLLILCGARVASREGRTTMRTPTIAIAVVSLMLVAGCGSLSKSSSSPFESSSASSESSSRSSSPERGQAYRDDVREYTQAYVKSGGDYASFSSGLSGIASKHGVSNWEADTNTYVGIGEGLKQAGVTPMQLEVWKANLSGGDPTKASAIQKGYDSYSR